MAAKKITANTRSIGLAKVIDAASPKKEKAAAPVAPPAPENKVRVAWNAGKTVAHHAVRVGKATFPSTWKAFEGIAELAKLPRGQHIKFRKALKAAPGGKLPFVDPNSKKVFPFELIAE